MEGRRHNSGMLAESNLLPLLQQDFHRANGSLLCIYGDPAYPLRAHLQRSFKGNHFPQEQKDFIKSMKTVHVSVEWVFKQIIRYFASMDFKKNNNNNTIYNLVLLEKCTLPEHFLTNVNTYLNKSQTSDFFAIEAPLLQEYFI